jgi:hypothetical protein
MGAWRYCPKCGQGMDAPTIREVIKGKQTCDEPYTFVCGYEREIDDHERDQAVEDFIERVEEMDKRLARLEALCEKTRLGGYPNELPA